MTLYCWVLGDEAEQYFLVEIPKTKGVAALQKVIKEEKRPQLDHLPADRLILWKVSIPFEETNAQLPAFQPKGDPNNGVVRLSPGDDLIDLFPVVPRRKCIHIIVQLPGESVLVRTSCSMNHILACL